MPLAVRCAVSSVKGISRTIGSMGQHGDDLWEGVAQQAACNSAGTTKLVVDEV